MNAAAIPWGALLTESVTMFLLLLGLGLGLIGMIAQQLHAETESGPGPSRRGLAYRFSFPLAET